jgi:hypothetical protein
MLRSLSKRTAFIAVTVVAAYAVSGCGATGSASFNDEAYPFSFDYPGTWTLSRNVSSDDDIAAQQRKSVSVALKEPYDQVTLTEFKLKKKLPKGENGFRPEVDRIVGNVVKGAKGKAGKAKVVKYGDAPGYQYVITYPGGEGVTLQSQLTFLFRGQYEYLINCQSSPENRDELQDGCDQILDSVQFKD